MFNSYFHWFFMVFFLSLIFFYFGLIFCLNDYFILFEYEFMFLNSFSFFYVVILDWKSLFFISIVMFISSMVILYSMQYMGVSSYSSVRFLYILLLFILSMVLMIISPNLLSILLGWDGLGLVSYCLVIYYNSVKSYLAGMITCLINRLGDAGILISLSWIFSFGSWHFIFFNDYYLDYLVFMIIFCSFTSSAQIPFSSWLPAAMAAPTPVSALVHSSTLVTAGVYMLIRFFSSVYIGLNWFVLLGLMTMVFSSFCASYEFDLKSVIALSTLSQLGLMMVSIFLNLVDYSYFHMLSHAMFKSLLFLCSGIYIYNMGDNQDIRYMGSCCVFMPLTTSCFNISNLSLCGIPFLSGFYSKDLIIECSLFMNLNFYVFFFFFLSLGLTCCYTSRLLYYTVYKKYFLMTLFKSFDYFDFMSISILVLTFFSVFFSCFFIWLMNFDLYFLVFPFYLKVFSLLMVILGFWFGFELMNFNHFFSLDFYLFNSYMWFMNGYLYFFYKLFYNYGYLSYNFMYWGEYMTSGSGFYFYSLSNFFQFYINNNFKIYMISFLFWFIFIII
uniref:NADH-ubiquinone oxidoreductase chain 5 n=1 Tax=Entylia carinata TaxID=1464891 RepID=A0A343AXP7_ENTCR|nr:NADH dehydrogenase subunit 5 [Entylia carinata]APU51895.1 NADH dehydrogenase subunit 5 [Entylia carinata]